MNSGITPIRFAAALVAGAALALVSACGGGPAWQFKSQQWRGMDVALESRPSPPRAGMNEFLVTVTDKRGRPGFDLIVSLRTGDDQPWVQAIEDGQMGVYRRAVKIEPGVDRAVQVQLHGRDATDVLQFPLPPQS
jgi:hypothetical protein